MRMSGEAFAACLKDCGVRPEIRERMVVVWLGGHSLHWPDTREFNMEHDVAAARIIFGCGVALVQLPCAGVVSEFATSGPELEYHLRGKSGKSCRSDRY